MKNKKIRALLIVGLCVVGASLFLRLGYQQLRGSREPAKPITPGQGNMAAHPSGLQKGKSSAPLAAQEFDATQLASALASGDPAAWMPLMGELKNPKYRREDAIKILLPLLNNKDPQVRYQAARELAFLGSTAGFPVLRSIIDLAARGEAVSPELVTYSVQTLHQFRQKIDPKALYTVYSQTKAPELMSLLMLQQVPELRELVEEKRKAGQLGYATEVIAAYSNMADPESIRNYQALLQAYPKAQTMAEWALFRATGDASYLATLIKAAQESVGVIPNHDSVPSGVGADALRFLQITVTPQATVALREITNYTIKNPNDDSLAFGRALAALFYVHEDYEFVDKIVLGYLNKEYPAKGLDRNLIMQIAAVRKTPQMIAAAKAYNPDLADRYFNQMAGRPVEGWINDYVSLVPVDVLPPLKNNGG